MYPDQENYESLKSTSSRWRKVPNSNFVVSIYLAKKNVGIFIRGIRNADSDDVYKQLEPHQDILEKDLGSLIGECDKSRGVFFHKKSYGDLTNNINWEDKVNWLAMLYKYLIKQSVDWLNGLDSNNQSVLIIWIMN